MIKKLIKNILDSSLLAFFIAALAHYILLNEMEMEMFSDYDNIII